MMIIQPNLVKRLGQDYSTEKPLLSDGDLGELWTIFAETGLCEARDKLIPSEGYLHVVMVGFGRTAAPNAQTLNDLSNLNCYSCAYRDDGLHPFEIFLMAAMNHPSVKGSSEAARLQEFLGRVTTALDAD